MFTIYVLVDPETQIVRYVGKTANPVDRLRRHRRLIAETPRIWRTRWIRSLQQRGLQPAMVVCDTCDDEATANGLECAWIKLFRMAGVPLTNHTDGGEGRLGHISSPETREKLRISSLAVWERRTERKASPETREKLRISGLAVWGRKIERQASQETIDRMRKAHKGHKPSQETREKFRRRRMSPEVLERIRQKNLGRRASPETREKMSVSALAAWRRRKGIS